MSSKKLTAEHGVVCSVPGERLGYFGWPTLCRMGDGTLLMVASGLRQYHICPYGKTTLCISRDDGKTWTWPRVIYDAAIDVRDAGICWLGGSRLVVTGFGTDPRQYLASEQQRKHLEHRFGKDPEGMAFWRLKHDRTIDADAKSHPRAWVQHSDDGGRTWQAPMAAPVSAPHGPIRLASGRLFYVGKDARDMFDASLLAVASDDGGRTWQTLSTLPDDPGLKGHPYHEPYAVELPGGKIIAMVRLENARNSQDAPLAALGLQTFSILQTESTDGGKTWTPLKSLGFHGCPPHLLRHSSGVLVMSYSFRQDPPGQRLAFSHDTGQTWEHDWILRDDGPSWDLGYPSTVELSDGSLLTAYYQAISKSDVNPSLLWSRWRLPI